MDTANKSEFVLIILYFFGDGSRKPLLTSMCGIFMECLVTYTINTIRTTTPHGVSTVIGIPDDTV